MKIKHMFILLAASVSTASCGFLDEYDPNATTVGNFYKSEADIVTSLNGVYASLTQSYYYTNNHYFTDVRSHDTAVTDSGANSGIPYQFYNYTLTEENSYVYNRYTQLFKTISRANTLLAHLDDVSYSNGDARNTYEAEIRFLRALTYFHLVTEWGDVPLILTELKTKDEVQANNYRRPKSEVYKAVFADLDYVLGSPLADMQPASECGRASKAAAWTLYGKAKLQYACDEDFASEKSASLTSAIEKLTAAWNLRSFGELSDIPYNAIWDLSTQKSCAENIFQINYIQNNADLGSTWNYLFGPSKTGITSNKVGLMQNMTTKSVYDAFAKEDVRKNYLRETTVAGVTYYHTMKYADLECGANGYGGNNWIVMRYADVALMLAEAYYWHGADGQEFPEHGPQTRRTGRLVGHRPASGHLRRAPQRVHPRGTPLAGPAAHVLQAGDDRTFQRDQPQLRAEGPAASDPLQRTHPQHRGTLPESGLRRKINRRRHAIHKQNHIDPLGDRVRAARCLLRRRHGGPRTGKRDSDHRLDARSSGQGRRSRLLARRQSG